MFEAKFQADYHCDPTNGDPALPIEAHFGGVKDRPPYAVFRVGPFTIFNMTPMQLRELAAVSARMADELEAATSKTEAAE